MKNIRVKDFYDECPKNFAGRHLCATRRCIPAKFQNRMDIQKGKEEINIGSMLMQIFDRVFEIYRERRVIDEVRATDCHPVEGSRGVCRFDFTRDQNAE